MATPVGLFVPSFHRLLETHASALSMNLQYRRTFSAEEVRRLYAGECRVLLLWTVALAAGWQMGASWKAPLLFFGVFSGIVWINAVRALVAHRYEDDGERHRHEDQYRDSIDIPGGLLTELWAPVGLRFHALHHLFPSLPYHNLPHAYRRLQAEAAFRAHLAQTEEQGLLSGVTKLVGSKSPRMAPDAAPSLDA